MNDVRVKRRTPPSADPSQLTRRQALAATLAVGGAAVVGCSDDEDGTGGAGGQGGAGGGGSGTTSTTSTTSASTTSASGGGQGGEGGQGGGAADLCAPSGNYSPETLLAPIDTIVVLMMENRSFDHYLGALRLLEGRSDVEGLVGTETNPAPDQTPVPIFKLDDYTVEDPPHGWDDCHAQFNGGANDGFVKEHAGAHQHEVMGYHVREQIPVMYALADHYAICDHWFASVMGPTWPNRYYLHGATSKGIQSNLPALGFQSVFGLLDDAGVSAKNYYHDIAWCSGAYLKLNGLAGIEQFFEDAEAGALPRFCIIDPQFFGGGANDDHPDHDIQLGQALIASVYAALAQSPHWGNCLFVITYDEHGGFYDHVPPPTTIDEDADFERLGFRVPSLVIGPHVRKGCVVKTQLEHVSVIKTLTVKHGLPLMNARVEATADLSCCIQPAYLEDPQPPIQLPPVTVNLAALRPRPASRHEHPEMWDAAERGLIPPQLDRRAQGEEIMRTVLAWGERLGAVRVVG